MRQNLKEAECKMLARRTGSAYEAHPEGKVANHIKAPSLYGIRMCICDGYKQESCAHYPGRSSLYLPEVRESAKGETEHGNMHRTPKKSAEAIVSSSTGTEGPNLEEKETRSLPMDREAGAEKRAEKLEAHRGKEIRKMEENL